MASTEHDPSTPAPRPRPRRLAVTAALSLVAVGTVAFPATASASPAVPDRAPVTHAAPAAPAVAPAATAARPRNGAVLVKRGSGSGRFTVDNASGGSDTVVTLSRGDRAVVVVYVRAGASATVSAVPDGTFDVYAEQGSGWDPAASAFTTPTSAGTFDRKATFTTERVRGGVRYSTITLTLGATPDGNARLLPVAGSSVPD